MTDHSSFTQDDYEILGRDVIYEGFATFARYHIKQRQFVGGWSEPFTREILERKPAVGVLPYDPVLDQIVFIEQFRPGAMANPESPWLIEIVAGVYGPDENPINVAKREAEEEAGCKILDLYPIYEYFVSPGASNEQFKLYCGRVDSRDVSGIYGLSEEHEDIRAFVLTTDDALKLLQQGKFKSPPVIISLMWLQLNRDWLKQLWQTK